MPVRLLSLEYFLEGRMVAVDARELLQSYQHAPVRMVCEVWWKFGRQEYLYLGLWLLTFNHITNLPLWSWVTIFNITFIGKFRFIWHHHARNFWWLDHLLWQLLCLLNKLNVWDPIGFEVSQDFSCDTYLFKFFFLYAPFLLLGFFIQFWGCYLFDCVPFDVFHYVIRVLVIAILWSHVQNLRPWTLWWHLRKHFKRTDEYFSFLLALDFFIWQLWLSEQLPIHQLVISQNLWQL